MKDISKSPEKRRKSVDIIEAKIFQISHHIKKELESGTDLGKIILKKTNKEDLGNLIHYIINKGKFFSKLNIDVIKYFLNNYTKYGNFEGDKDLFLNKLGMSMRVEEYPKDYLLFRKNDLGYKFYIILKGSVSIIITQEINIDMTENEYNNHLEKLKYYKEYQLLEKILSYENKLEIKEDLLESIKDEIYLENLKKRNLKKRGSIQSPRDNKRIISAQQFIERVEPLFEKKENKLKINVKIPVYKIVANLKTGDTFGEIALSKIELEERKRTATIITDTDCIFGILPFSVYSTFLKEVEEKERFNLANKLISHSLFKTILTENFLKSKFLNYFKNMTIKGQSFLFKQGEIRNSLFFVTDGIIDLYTESSIDNIIKIIDYLKKDIAQEIKKENNDKIKNKSKEEENYNDFIMKYQSQKKSNNLFNKFCKIKRIFKIFNINKKETLGFDDCLLHDDKFFITAKIMSANCHVFVLKLNFLTSILREKIIQRNYIRTNIEKKKIMINRLTSMIKMLINRFLNINKVTNSNKDYLEEQKKVDINILKNENISFKTLKNENKKFSFSNPGYKNFFKNFKNKKYNAKFINIMKPKIRLDFELPLFENKLGKAKSKSMKRIHKNVNFKNKLLNISINFSNDNLPKKKKFSLPFMDEIKSFKSEKAKSDKAQEKFKTEMIKINSENEKINNLIPNIKKLYTKYMINEYGNKKNKIKNMTQLDFLFFDQLFASQGNKQYSREPLELSI